MQCQEFNMAFMDYMPQFGQNTAQTQDLSGIPANDAAAQLEMQRRLRMAQSLQEQQSPQGQMVSGHYVAPSWTQYAAQLANKVVGNQQEQEAIKQYGIYQKTKAQKQADALKELSGALEPKEVEQYADYNESRNMPLVETKMQQPTASNLTQALLSYGQQTGQPNIGEKAVMSRIEALNKVKPDTQHILPAGGVMVDAEGNVLYSNPRAPSIASQRPFVPPMQTYTSGDKKISERWNPETKRFEQIGVGAAHYNKPAAEATLPPNVLNSMAEQALTGDKSVFTNVGRGAQGAANLVALRTAMNQKMQERGWNGADIAAANAEFAGTTAAQRSIATKAGNISMAATEAMKVMPLALAASDKVVRSGFLPFGKAEVMFNAQTNDPNLREFATANNALVNIYSRAISPTGNPTVSDKDHARELLSTAYDQKSYNAIVGQMQKEIDAAMESPKAVRESLRSSITGRIEPGAKSNAMPKIKSDAEYNALPSGSLYIDPNGQQRKKK